MNQSNHDNYKKTSATNTNGKYWNSVKCTSCHLSCVSVNDFNNNYELCRSCYGIYCTSCIANNNIQSSYYSTKYNINSKTDVNKTPICEKCIKESGLQLETGNKLKKRDELFNKFKADYISSNLRVTNHIAENHIKNFF